MNLERFDPHHPESQAEIDRARRLFRAADRARAQRVRLARQNAPVALRVTGRTNPYPDRPTLAYQPTEASSALDGLRLAIASLPAVGCAVRLYGPAPELVLALFEQFGASHDFEETPEFLRISRKGD